MLREIKFGCGLEPIHPAAQVDLVAIQGEYLLLGKGALDLNGEKGFLELAREVTVGREKEVARQLHGEGRSALRAVVGAEVVYKGAADAQHVHAPVRLKGLVFDGDHGLAKDGRKSVEVHHLAAFKREGPDNTALAVVKVGQGGGAVVLQLVDLGQVDGVDAELDRPGNR